MKKFLLFTFILLLLLLTGAVLAQKVTISRHSNPKKLVTIPGVVDSSGKNNFCICKIVSYTSDSYEQRTDAIFAASTPGNKVTKKYLLKNIKYELQRAMLFFDSYKLVRQYAAKADCGTLYRYLKEEHESINHYTVLLPSYASR